MPSGHICLFMCTFLVFDPHMRFLGPVTIKGEISELHSYLRPRRLKSFVFSKCEASQESMRRGVAKHGLSCFAGKWVWHTLRGGRSGVQTRRQSRHREPELPRRDRERVRDQDRDQDHHTLQCPEIGLVSSKSNLDPRQRSLIEKPNSQ